jgi:(p)ppGpp synthase/HD superfamily hydrolase
MLTNYQEFEKLNKLAQSIAEQAHQNQKYGTLPYSIHLEHVVRVLHKFKFKVSEQKFNPDVAKVLIAAWLHDVLEDTVLQKSHLEYHFGLDVTDLVYRVTDEPGKTRKEKKMATYPKIKESYWATVLKLADRIANVEAATKMKTDGQKSLFKMYQKEYADFRSCLYSDTGPEEMWKHLDKLLS